jgi:hypothetical protein
MQVLTRGGHTVRFFGTGFFFATLLSWSSASAQSSQWITIGKDFLAFHEDKFRALNMKLEPPITSDVEILVELIGLPNIPKINALRLQIRRIYGLKNAASLEGEGYRTIAYDPDWAAGDTPGFYLALGHEAGHHFCGHSIGNVRGNRSQIELEADQFGGASIKRYEIYHNRNFFSQVYSAAMAKYSEQSSFLYPPSATRLAALKRGYEQGSQCGGLAPVEQSGFSPGVRATGAPRPCRPVRTGPTSYACE